jgi:hypothetical protein
VLAILLVLACSAAILVSVDTRTVEGQYCRLEFRLRFTSITFVYESYPDEIRQSGFASRYALYDWKFRLRLEAVWTIHGFALTVCQ